MIGSDRARHIQAAVQAPELALAGAQRSVHVVRGILQNEAFGEGVDGSAEFAEISRLMQVAAEKVSDARVALKGAHLLIEQLGASVGVDGGMTTLTSGNKNDD